MRRHVLLSGGPAHPYATTSAMVAGLFDSRSFETEIVTEPSDLLGLLRADGSRGEQRITLVTVNALRWSMTQERFASDRAEFAVTMDPAELAVIEQYVRAGGGLLALHTAVICFDADPTWRELCGASWRWGQSSHPPAGPVDVEVTPAGQQHVIGADIEPFQIEDEAYGFLDEAADLEPLLVTSHGGRCHPLLWTRAIGAGRVVTSLLGHGPASFDHPCHRTILARAASWATGTDAVPTPGFETT